MNAVVLLVTTVPLFYRQAYRVKRNTKMPNTSYLRWESSFKYRYFFRCVTFTRLPAFTQRIEQHAAKFNNREMWIIRRTITWTVTEILL